MAERRRTARQAGFTLVELSVVVAVAGVLAGLSLGALERMRSQARVRASLPGLVAAIEQARSESASRGAPVVVVLQKGVDGRVRWQSFLDPQADFDPSGTNVAQADDVLLADGTLAPELTLSAAEDAPPLPQPLSRVKADVACSFCDGHEGVGAIRFHTDGTARLGVASSPFGGSFTVRVDDGAPRHETVVVLSATGLVRRVER